MPQKLYRLLLILLPLSFAIYFVTKSVFISPQNEEENIVNIYNWYGMMDPTVIEDFEKETGIHVNHDLFDNNEIVETKLIAGRSGYDVVFPTAFPYVERMIMVGAFMPLDTTKLPNLKNVDPVFFEKMHSIDSENKYAIPYFWGTLGIAINLEEVKKRLGDNFEESYALLFDPKVIEKLSSCGVTLLEESVDVYPNILRFLGLDGNSSSPELLEKAQALLLKIRKFITRFSSTRFTHELMSGETCVAQAWSGDIHMAIDQAKAIGKEANLYYIIPKEGSTLWIDVLAIPKDAPHPTNAHAFIDFLLRPDIAARVTNYVKAATSIKDAQALVDKSIAKDKTIFPPKEVMDKLKLDQLHTPEFEKKRNRAWTEVRTSRHRDE